MTELHLSLFLETPTEPKYEDYENEKTTVEEVMEILERHQPSAIMAAAKIVSELPPPVRFEGGQTVLLDDEARVRILLGKTTLKDEVAP